MSRRLPSLTSRSARELSGKRSQQAYNSAASCISTSHASDPSSMVFKQVAACSSHVRSRGEDKARLSANEHSKNGLEISHEAVNTKGFSSVSVQNVHAMGRLPHMLDGTTDSQRRSAKSMLWAAGKGKNPRIMDTQGGAPDGFYRPSRREVRGPTVDSDDVFRPRIAGEEM